MARKKIIILVLTAVGVVGVAMLFFGFLPVITVGGASVSLSELLKIEGALSKFDRLSQRTPSSDSAINKKAIGNIIEQKFLDILIQNTDTGLTTQAQKLVEDTVHDSQNKGIAISQAADTLYGLSESDFKKYILLPQAKRDVLVAYFNNDQSRLKQSWTAIYKNTAVKIYYPGYHWQNGEVKTK